MSQKSISKKRAGRTRDSLLHNDTAPQQVDVLDRGAERPSSSEISLGKCLSPSDEASSVAAYAKSIGAIWDRTVTAMMQVACLCADASERLTPDERETLVRNLPFGQTTFSKFVTIGRDERLQAPSVQRLLPPYYTTVYLLTQLCDDDLDRAIDFRALHPDTTRARLQKWLNANCSSHSSEETALPANADPHPATAQPEESSALARDNPSPDLAQETSMPVVDVPVTAGNADQADSAADQQETTSTLVAYEEGFNRPFSADQAFDAAVSPSLAPTADAGALSVSDRRLPSLDDQQAFEALKTAWTNDGVLNAISWARVSTVVQELFIGDILRAISTAVSDRRG